MKKRMLHQFLAGALLMFVAAQLQAATEEQIAKVIKQVNDIRFMEGQFVQQKKITGIDYPLKSQGQFMFWKGQGLYLATEKPFFNAMTITGSGMIVWQADGTAALAQEQSGIIQREVNKTLLAFFSADIAAIEQRFNVEWGFDKEQWQLSLTPKLDVIQKNMRVAIIRGRQFMNELSVIGANGDQTDLSFSGQQQSAQPTAIQCHKFYLPAQDLCNKL
ncbi:MAG TPA: outer membrane lipoprotein carrier protein LolA [Cellvibrio sp.]|nr:outer membrane lipoprotein carrier protein LolA [Cellvibrio sp.]